MDSFKQAYEQLNGGQRAAVDAISGPIMVIAGPGTGKTQLLATRVANILQKDSTLLPTNILCLTFTEAGQVAMQRRLISIMGDAGAHVAVHTFHSFGSEIMGRFPQYFYRGMAYTPTDELTTHEILLEIFESLPHNHTLSTTNQGEYVYLPSIKKRLKQLKKAAITPEELRQLATDGLSFTDYIEPSIVELFDVPSFSKKDDIERAQKVLEYATSYEQKTLTIPGFASLSEVFLETFERAIEAAQTVGKPKPINDWKSSWYHKNAEKKPVCKQRAILERLMALAELYELYQASLDARRMFDFDDMIMRVVHALENDGELAYELQEQYQYFLVDEFQDTNAGQLRLLHALANHPVNEGKPNVMVVGDDDQAIYAFQGAELSNILGFEDAYQDVQTYILTDNYRSKSEILASARQVIVQGIDRLENHKTHISKELTALGTIAGETKVVRELFETQAQEFDWLALSIKELLEDGHKPAEIAVICREHKYLEALVPYLLAHKVPVWYERQQNALQDPVVGMIVLLARTIDALSRDDLVLANSFLPELLSAPFWDLQTADIWKLSLETRSLYEREKRMVSWLETMLEKPVGTPLKSIADFLLECARLAVQEPVETVLDALLGNTTLSATESEQEEGEEKTSQNHTRFISPFRMYYFSDAKLQNQPSVYVNTLAALTAIRNKLRQYRPDQLLTLKDFIYFIDLCKSSRTAINVVPLTNSAEHSVQLMSAHGSKGLEFETVFMLSAQKSVWDKAVRADSIALAPNMLQVAHRANPDDALRLFYVAMTRAKRQLILTHHLQSENGKQAIPFAALEHPSVVELLLSPKDPRVVIKNEQDALRLSELSWHDRHYELPKQDLKSLLQNRLSNYHLSATHLNNFLDVTSGGPQAFLLGNLLQFPTAMSPSAGFGSAIHDTLEHMHNHLIKQGIMLSEKALHEYFEQSLQYRRLSANDHAKYAKRGTDALSLFLQTYGKQVTSSQLPEQDFRSQGVIIAGARLTGKLDVMEVQDKHILVTDYKTGGALADWQPSNKTVYEKIKQHKYHQQLYFYKLLVDGSRSWGAKGLKALTGQLVFVEPNKAGDIVTLSLPLTDTSELTRLTELTSAVWKHIQDLHFPDTSSYEPTLAGIRQFEDDLLAGTI